MGGGKGKKTTSIFHNQEKKKRNFTTYRLFTGEGRKKDSVPPLRNSARCKKGGKEWGPSEKKRGSNFCHGLEGEGFVL